MSMQDRYPNFRNDGRFYLVRCFVCEPQYGRENMATVVADGLCAWCGWTEQPNTPPDPDTAGQEEG